MQQSLTRLGPLEAAVEGLSEAPAVALLGARQVGKTTLAAQVASAWNGPSTVSDLEVTATRAARVRRLGRARRGAAHAGSVRGAAPDL